MPGRKPERPGLDGGGPRASRRCSMLKPGGTRTGEVCPGIIGLSEEGLGLSPWVVSQDTRGKASRQKNVAIIRDWCYPRIPWKVLSHR